MIDQSTLAAASNHIHSLADVPDTRKADYIRYLRELRPEYQDLVSVWLTTGTVPEAELKGISVQRLVAMMSAHPLVAVIMLDRLSKDPDAYRPLIRMENGEFRFVARDAPRGYIPSPPAPSALTQSVAEAVGSHLLAEGFNPPELRFNEGSTARLGSIVASLASAADADDLAEEVEDLRRIVDLAGEIPDEPDRPLSQVQRVGLVLRLLAELATDDLRKIRAEGEGGA